jgi:long-chain acyl-CoA synthetase
MPEFRTATNPYASRPWLARYSDRRPKRISPEYTDALAMFRATAARAAGNPALRYFDGALTFAELDAQSDALACALLASGFAAGDRLGLYLQNVPQFVIGLIAAWKAGGIGVPINPMNRERELSLIVGDSGLRALLCHPGLYREFVAPVLRGRGDLLAIVTSERAYQSRDDQRVLPREAVEPSACAPALDLAALLAQHRGETPAGRPRYSTDDVAMLVYTSGTTGVT